LTAPGTLFMASSLAASNETMNLPHGDWCASARCEYCRIPESASFALHEIAMQLR
jgi:hypothetical protein